MDIGKLVVSGARPARLVTGVVGFFPRVSFIPLDGELDTLRMIAKTLKEQCTVYLEKPDDRKFKVHVTLARHRKPLKRFEKEQISELGKGLSGLEFDCNELVLFESELTRSGAIYTPIEVFRFGNT